MMMIMIVIIIIMMMIKRLKNPDITDFRFNGPYHSIGFRSDWILKIAIHFLF